jgi:hypothetical protein
MAEIDFLTVHRRPTSTIAAHRFKGGEEEAERIISWIRTKRFSARWMEEVKGQMKYDPIKDAHVFTGSPERIRIDTDSATQDLHKGDWLYIDEFQEIRCMPDELFQATFQKIVDNERI